MLFLLSIFNALAYPSGAPVCTNDLSQVSMQGVKHQGQDGGYTITAATSGANYAVTLTAPAGQIIQGFLLYGENSAGQRVGTWVQGSVNSAQATTTGNFPATCRTGNTVTQAQELSAPSVTLSWTPPAGQSGPFTFKSIVYSTRQFWTPQLTAGGETTTAAPATTTSAPATMPPPVATSPARTTSKPLATMKPAATTMKPVVSTLKPATTAAPGQCAGFRAQIRPSTVSTPSKCLQGALGGALSLQACKAATPAQVFLLSQSAQGYKVTTGANNACLGLNGAALAIRGLAGCGVFTVSQVANTRLTQFQLNGQCLTSTATGVALQACATPATSAQQFFVEPRF